MFGEHVWSASKSNNNMLDNDRYSYQFGNSLAKGKKASSSYTSVNDVIPASSSGIQNRPLCDITLSISNTNQRRSVRKCPSSSKENEQFLISPDKTAVCKEKTLNALSVNSSTKIILLNGKSDVEAKLNSPTTSAEVFEKLRTTHDYMCSSDSFNELKRDEENATACDMSHMIENLEDKSESHIDEDAFVEKFCKETSSSSTSNDSWYILEDDTSLDLINQGSFSIDPQKTSEVSELSSKMTYGLQEKKENVKRKLNFGPDLFKSPTKSLKLSQKENHKSHKVITQSTINDYFKVKKFSSNECQNNLTSTNLLKLPDFEEPIKSEFDNGVKLIPTSEHENADRIPEEFTHNSQTPLTDSETTKKRKFLKMCKNEAIIYNGPKVVVDHHITNELIVKRVSEVLLTFLVSLADAEKHLTQNETSQKSTRKLRLSIPYDYKVRQRRSSLIIYLLGKIFSLITQKAHCSQRQLYYELKAYASNQSHIASVLMTISIMIKIAPWYLPINSTSVGLVYGNLKIVASNNNVMNCLNFGGTLIPQDVLQIMEVQSDATFILVVEKDAIFKKMLDENICQTMGTSCIVITGKGFPDYNTRLFLKLLWRHLKIPVFILCDGDPYGIEIMLTYRFGSTKQPHFLEDITIPQIQWIGILPSDINRLAIPSEDLTREEVVKVRRMLLRPYVKENPRLHNELTIMLENQKKAGIEAVVDNYYSLTKFYITGKLFSGDFF